MAVLKTCSVAEAAERLSITQAAVRKALNEDRLDGVVCGSRYFILENSLSRFEPRTYTKQVRKSASIKVSPPSLY